MWSIHFLPSSYITNFPFNAEPLDHQVTWHRWPATARPPRTSTRTGQQPTENTATGKQKLFLRVSIAPPAFFDAIASRNSRIKVRFAEPFRSAVLLNSISLVKFWFLSPSPSSRRAIACNWLHCRCGVCFLGAWVRATPSQIYLEILVPLHRSICLLHIAGFRDTCGVDIKLTSSVRSRFWCALQSKTRLGGRIEHRCVMNWNLTWSVCSSSCQGFSELGNFLEALLLSPVYVDIRGGLLALLCMCGVSVAVRVSWTQASKMEAVALRMAASCTGMAGVATCNDECRRDSWTTCCPSSIRYGVSFLTVFPEMARQKHRMREDGNFMSIVVYYGCLGR